MADGFVLLDQVLFPIVHGQTLRSCGRKCPGRANRWVAVTRRRLLTRLRAELDLWCGLAFGAGGTNVLVGPGGAIGRADGQGRLRVTPDSGTTGTNPEGRGCWSGSST